ncbi:MAG: ABC transporter permease [Chloroflexota bacterium]
MWKRPRRRVARAAQHATGLATPGQLFRWKFRRHRLAVISLGLLVVLYGVAILAEFIAPNDPYQTSANLVYAPPQRLYFVDAGGSLHIPPFVYPQVKAVNPTTLRVTYTEDKTTKLPVGLLVHGWRYRFLGLVETDLHLFGMEHGTIGAWGRDALGRDLLSRLILGSRISLSIGLVGVFVGFLSGLLLGGLAGLKGGRTDLAIMRVSEIFGSIPTLPIWMVLAAILPQNWTVEQTYIAMTLILALFGVVSGASRTIRGRFFALREEEFVMAARLDGAGTGRLIRRYLFPHVLSQEIADITMAIPGMILAETALSFLGLGLQAPAISWGVLLQEGRSVQTLAYSPWLFIPAIVVIVTVLAFNFVGDGIRDAADPYARV